MFGFAWTFNLPCFFNSSQQMSPSQKDEYLAEKAAIAKAQQEAADRLAREAAESNEQARRAKQAEAEREIIERESERRREPEGGETNSHIGAVASQPKTLLPTLPSDQASTLVPPPRSNSNISDSTNALQPSDKDDLKKQKEKDKSVDVQDSEYLPRTASLSPQTREIASPSALLSPGTLTVAAQVAAEDLGIQASTPIQDSPSDNKVPDPSNSSTKDKFNTQNDVNTKRSKSKGKTGTRVTPSAPSALKKSNSQYNDKEVAKVQQPNTLTSVTDGNVAQLLSVEIPRSASTDDFDMETVSFY